MFVLQALLNIFLVESVPLLTKRLIVMYLLFDLKHLSDEEQTEKVSLLFLSDAEAQCVMLKW